MADRFAAALRDAAAAGDSEKLERVLQEANVAGCLLKIVDRQDIETDLAALSLAAAAGDVDSVRYLLRARANPNLESEDSGNRTPLHFAAFEGYAEVVSLLLDANADASKSCTTGGTAKEIAQQRAKEWRIGGGDGEEDIQGLERVLELLST
eukprot:TRINITY_DN15471_c0_g1_i4.p1 TRINITY_DN15471_c0_g1~~TRINITY_DN15471_c0_g1_i4.p1  ORF type:complete len:152 (-),score=41.80 TRINITY_DN15471_c0_g1_i4:55-510(-)